MSCVLYKVNGRPPLRNIGFKLHIEESFVLLGYVIKQGGGMIAKLFRTKFLPLGVIIVAEGP